MLSRFEPDTVIVCLLILSNIVSVVGIVAINKVLFSPPYSFNFPTSLMSFHFLCTWTFVLVAKNLGWYAEKRVEGTAYMKLGFSQMLAVATVNLSLMHNPIDMYQVMKFTNVLVLCCIEYVWKGKVYANEIYGILLVLVVGVIIATVSSIEVRTLGLVVGVAGSLSNAGYQVYNKHVQTEYDVKPLQLLQFEQPYTALFSALFALCTENVAAIPYYDFTLESTGLILLSGIFAFGVNVTTYGIIGKTSPVTFNVVGHVKTILILSFGFVFMKDILTMKKFVGLSMAFGAIVAYGQFAGKAAAAASAAVKEKLREHDEEEEAGGSPMSGAAEDDSGSDVSMVASPIQVPMSPTTTSFSERSHLEHHHHHHQHQPHQLLHARAVISDEEKHK